MNFELKTYSLGEFLGLWHRRDLVVNHEYQRAPRWSRTQQQLLLDSVLRGYPLPMFFVHRRMTPGMDGPEPRLEVIDGQQRLRAVANYCGNQFRLLNPSTHRRGFPSFIVEAPELTPWAGKKHDQLDESDRAALEEFELQVAVVETPDDNLVRDLFVRLQAGTPLRPQEKRDALPGGMTEFIKRLGGAVEESDDQLPIVVGGHRFFKTFLRLGSPSNTVNARQVAAQMVVNLTRTHKGLPLTSSDSKTLDDFYHEQVSFAPDGKEANRLWGIFDEVTNAFIDNLKSRPNRTDWVHMMLLWQRLRDHHGSGWESELPGLMDEFKGRLARAKADAQAGDPAPMWSGYGMHVSGQGDTSARKIALRQDYFDSWFMKQLGLDGQEQSNDHDIIRDLELKDALYRRQERLCAFFDNAGICDSSPMEYDDCLLHKIALDSNDGIARPSTLVLVHAACRETVGERHVPVTSPIIRNAITESRHRL